MEVRRGWATQLPAIKWRGVAVVPKDTLPNCGRGPTDEDRVSVIIG